MKILIKKLKKAGKGKMITYILNSTIYLITLIFFIIALLKLKDVENIIRIISIIFFIIWFIIYILLTPIFSIIKKKKSFFFINLLTIIFYIIFIIGSLIINGIFGGLSSFNRDYITYTTNLIVLNDHEFSNKDKIGMYDNESDIEGNQLAKKLIKEENLDNEIIKYDNYYSMISDLYNKEIDGIFVSSNYSVLFANEELYSNIKNEVTVIYEYSERLKNQDYTNTTKKSLTEPFSVLLMGVDSEYDGLEANQAFNGDTLMLLTFNPNTLSATMFSMPRDMYVPIACQNNNKAKVNSSAAYGTNCVIDTLEGVTNTPIDYFVKLNFKAVVDLVDAVGGITVDIQEPDFQYNHGYDCKGKFCEQNSDRNWGKDTIFLDPGVQKINGEEALAYARCRALYWQSDIARNQHQQDIVTALINELKNIRSLSEFQNILDSISKNMDTNISPNQMISLYNTGKDMLLNNNNLNEIVSIQKTYLEYYDLPILIPGTTQTTSALGYYEASMKAISNAMRANLELEEPKLNKTFTISYNEEYTTKAIGQGITDDSKIETLPNFANSSIDYTTNWLTEKGITYYLEYTNQGEENYGYGIAPGLIANQSVKYGTDIKNINSITLYINNTPTDEEQTIPENNEEPNEDPTIPGFPQ